MIVYNQTAISFFLKVKQDLLNPFSSWVRGDGKYCLA